MMAPKGHVVNGGGGNTRTTTTTTTTTTDDKKELSEELKLAIAVEVRAQIVPVVKEIVREVVSEVRSVMTDVMAPIYDELHRLRNITNNSNNNNNNGNSGGNNGSSTNGNSNILGANNGITQHHHALQQLHAVSGAAAAVAVSSVAAAAAAAVSPATVVAYPTENTILAEVYAATNHAAAAMGATACADAATAAAVAAQNAQLQQFLKENVAGVYEPNKDKMYLDEGASTKNSTNYIEQSGEPRARESTSDCIAFNYHYYNTASTLPILTMMEPGSNMYVCQKVPNIFLGKEGGKISFLVDTRAVPLKDLTSDNLGSWTCRFTAHMKSRKYMVKDGKVLGHIKQDNQIYTVTQDYDYILHRQYYCHGNTIGPGSIRKNIWFLTNKLSGGDAIGCAIISYEIGDNAAVKISKLRQRTMLGNSSENSRIPKAEMTTASDEMDVNSVPMNPNAELQRFVNNIQLPPQ